MLRCRFLQLAWLGFLILPGTRGSAAGAEAPPKIFDDRLELTLFAEDPEIVTPIGLAIDARDRLFVIESHTHMPPKDYQGPKSDQIKIFEDANRDGKPDRITRFADGLKDAMNLAFSPDGVLYAVCAREVWVLEDNDKNDVSESRRRILELRTSNMYSHSALLGITFGPDGWLYISRGNNASAAYTLAGTDGSKVSGYGDGGNIVRCRPDGSKLEEFATGFWNPFDIKFDALGRLLCVDNDPDARGPNRLLHVVPQGDYGYKSLYGGSGNHPFQAWEGELPGTLPMIDGTGEAPSGLIDCARAALPADYAGNLLVTVWNENTITRHSTSLEGVSISANHSVLVAGGQNFRPVALQADSRGAIYITDWVLVDYPNHGRGRIWKLSGKPGEALTKPRGQFAAPDKDVRFERFNHLLASSDPGAYALLESALRTEDPFVRHASVVALARPAFREQILAAAKHSDPRIRLGALLALRRAGISRPEPLLRAWLADPSEPVRRMALVWTGELMLEGLKDSIETALVGGDISASLFESYLAAVECLDPDYIQAYRSRAKEKASQLQRKLPSGLLESIVADTNRPPRVRALALARLENPGAEAPFRLLTRLAVAADPPLQKEALRTLAQVNRPEVGQVLSSVAIDRSQGRDARAEALLGLSRQLVVDPIPFLALLNDPDAVVQLESVRLLRMHAGEELVRAALKRKLQSARSSKNRIALVEQLEQALFPPGSDRPPESLPRPRSLEEWQSALARSGDPAAGERVFFSTSTACSQCHTIDSRGGNLGPDLSNIGQSVNRTHMIHSILRPSDQFPPQYQAWFIATRDGEVHQGLQLDHKAGGALELLMPGGEFKDFKASEIVSYGVLPNSLMPDGLEETMTVSEFRDLVAFLESLK